MKLLPRKIVYLLSLGLIMLSCKKDTITDPVPKVPNVQKDIEWPGLTNSPWPMFMQNPQLTGRSRYKGPKDGIVNWEFTTGDNIYSSPVVDENGTIYFGSNDGFLYSVTSSGVLNWKYQVTQDIIAAPILSSDGTIYFLRGVGGGVNNGALFAINRNGQLKWKYDLVGVPSRTSPIISIDGKTIIVKTNETVSLPSHLYAISSTGEKKWEIIKEGNERFNFFTPSFSPDGATLYVPGMTKIYAVDTSGNIKWDYSVGVYTSSASVDNDGNLYFSTISKCYSLNNKGVLRWTYPVFSTFDPLIPSITYDGRIVIVSSDTVSAGSYGYFLFALDNSGKFLWRSYISGFSQGNPISDIDGNVFVSAYGRLNNQTDSVNFCSIRKDGVSNFRIKLRSPDGSIPDIDSTPAIDEFGNLYVGSNRQGKQLYSIK